MEDTTMVILTVVFMFIGAFLGSALTTASMLGGMKAELHGLRTEFANVKTKINALYDWRNEMNQEVVRMKTVCVDEHPDHRDTLNRDLR